MRWGLVPSWATDPGVGDRMINARAETVLEKPAFRTALERRRCIVPADGFYEWERVGSRKQPMYIHDRSGAPLAFAGLWAVWRDADVPDAPWLRSCTIVTTRRERDGGAGARPDAGDARAPTRGTAGSTATSPTAPRWSTCCVPRPTTCSSSGR